MTTGLWLSWTKITWHRFITRLKNVLIIFFTVIIKIRTILHYQFNGSVMFFFTALKCRKPGHRISKTTQTRRVTCCMSPSARDRIWTDPITLDTALYRKLMALRHVDVSVGHMALILKVPAGSPSRGGDVTVYVWHKPTELAHSVLFCSCV